MNQHQISSRPRHLRYVFFISEDYDYTKLLELICENQKKWGGRHNPIIPVKENVISEGYNELLRNYDPDFIFFSEKIDPDIIKRLQIFNPLNFTKIDDRRRIDIDGVDAFYLISQFNADAKVVLTGGLWKTKSPLLDFYKINFGLESDTYVSEAGIAQKSPKIEVDTDNFKDINEILL